MTIDKPALDALEEIQTILDRRFSPGEGIEQAFTPIDSSTRRRMLCADYELIRPKLDIALIQLDKLPAFGRHTATAIRFLMYIADDHCGNS